MNYYSKSILFGVVLLVFLFLPHVGWLQYLNPLLLLLIVAVSCKGIKLSFIQFLMVLSVFVSFALSVTTFSDSKSILKSITIIMCLLLYSNIEKVKIPNSFYYIGVIVILLSQIAYIFNWSLLIGFFNEYYISEETLDYYQRYQDYSFSSIRFGGIYNNPNQCARTVSFLMVYYFLDNNLSIAKKNILFISLCFASIVLTGSRTGMGFALVSVLFFYLRNKSIHTVIRMLPVLILAGVILLLFVPSNYEIRGFDFAEGVENSIGSKQTFLRNYLSNQHSVLRLLVGMFWTNANLINQFTSGVSSTLDSEWGWSIYTYGFVFLALYIVWMVCIFKEAKNNNNKIIVVIFLWAISSTLLFSYRALFIFTLLLSKVVGKNGDYVCVDKTYNVCLETDNIK